MIRVLGSGLWTALLLVAVLAAARVVAAPADRLPALAAAADGTTASGISSGGYMAVQLHVAHSRLVRGAAIFAAGPYYCAQGSVWAARYNCMDPGTWTPLPKVSVLVHETRALAAAGQIDPPEALHGARVWLFSGTRDEVVRPQVVEALREYYRAFVPEAQVALVSGIAAGHAMVTSDYGSACATTGPPFINDCDYDGAGQALKHLYGELAPPAPHPAGQLLTFDQKEFAGSPYAISMDDSGFVFLPDTCRAGGCRVHVAFHGCLQGRETLGDNFAQHAGFARWAASNRIVVLYPQAISRSGWGWPMPSNFVYNPKGCWDWWGYTGANYHTRTGAQIQAVKAMLDRLREAVR